MLSEKTVKKIQNLLGKEQFSQRKVAKLCGVSRSAVLRVLRQSKREVGPTTRKKVQPTRHADIVNSGEITLPHGEYQRCPICGGKVQMPCLACHLRKKREASFKAGRPQAVPDRAVPIAESLGAEDHPAPPGLLR